MKITQYIHRPNLTELGMGNTNDKYLVGPETILKDFFPEGKETLVVDENNEKKYSLYSKIENSEFRVKKLGDIFDDYQMDPGDELVFTRCELNDSVIIKLRVNECGRVFLNQGKSINGKVVDFEIVNLDLFSGFNKRSPYTSEYTYMGKKHKLEIYFSENRKKRKDSPDSTDFFSVKYDDDNLINKKNIYYYISIRKGSAILKELPKYEYSVIVDDSIDKSQIADQNVFQRIFYGAPGTGKSHIVNDLTNGKIVYRTTFHPDSDYSTFVGAYKPTMATSEKKYSVEELILKLKAIKNTGTTYPCHKFASKYWESLKDLSVDETKSILSACGFTDAYTVEISKGVAIGQEYLNKKSEGKISYAFVPQVFAKAYVNAWKVNESVYLIIEEINRGNCAQIFGDLFQLLDRKEGVSKYSIDTDSDLGDYIASSLADNCREDIPIEVKEGKKLILPSNLYIWATMNTSDQSLFPIDSAFKRRWDWKYMKIRNYPEKNYQIKIGEKMQSWYGFIKKINEIIASMTSSADKQLGYFFCVAEDGIIDEKTFVSKVIFYLWNDVFKDYGFEDASLFQYVEKDEADNEKIKELTFPDFYKEDGEEVNIVRLADFIEKVMSWKKTNEENS